MTTETDYQWAGQDEWVTKEADGARNVVSLEIKEVRGRGDRGLEKGKRELHN